MCNFNKQDENTRAFIHLLMQKSADSVGGTNFLLGLHEAIKEKKPNALIFKGCEISSKEVKIRWNKIVFKDKLDILETIIRSHKSSEGYSFNILETDNAKKQKKVLNMLKTLAPIEFIVSPLDASHGGGFKFKIFEDLEDTNAKLNPLFIALFFCSIEFTKKALKYTI